MLGSGARTTGTSIVINRRRVEEGLAGSAARIATFIVVACLHRYGAVVLK